MNFPTETYFQRVRRRGAFSSTRSSALVIVLACLAIITVLIVAFMASVSTERQSAQFFANSSSVKLLAESAVSVVMGQIKDATKGTDSSGNTLAWASQPGMIRTYNTVGQPSGYYKLYSWANMAGSGAFDPSVATETPPSTWMQSPALYTDLNDPVSGVYPIVDPAATTLVNGFTTNGAPASSTDSVPMPVQWLYVLQDGTLAPASGGVGNTATVAAATPSNRIVARIAFWTDDDTCKVNINTAAGDVWTSSASAPSPGSPGNPGSFWDVPRTANASFEQNYLAKYQPAANEFQRYPGHPATTYLSAVFPSLTAAQIDAIAPRVAPGGSVSGTQVATSAITPDSDRLYASVDELMFTTNIASGSRSVNSPLTQSQIEQAKFFLTAHSRAPEVNLFNQPRVVIWPVSSQTNTGTAIYRTPHDSLIAYCGTLNPGTSGTPYQYYFQRGPYVAGTSGCDSATADLPTPAVTPASPSTDLTRNRQLILYLRNLTSLPIPGFSTSTSQTFLGKYPLDRDEILTEIFDYIRSVNAQDNSISGLNSYAVSSTSHGGVSGQGQILPIADSSHSDSNTATLRGFGRFFTVREAGIVFVGVGQHQGANYSQPPLASQSPGTTIADGKTRAQAFFYLNFFDPNQGYAISVPNFWVRISNLGAFTWNGTTMFPTSNVSYKITANSNTGNYGGYKGASTFVDSACSSANFLSSTLDLPSNSSGSPTTFSFGGGNVTVQIYDASNTTLLQTLTIPFPIGPTTLPVPYLAPELHDTYGGSPGTPIVTDFRNLTCYTGSFGSLPTTVGRFTGSGNANTSASTSTKMWVCGKDVIRSVEANTDLRLIAAQTNVPSSFFSEIEPDYGTSTVFQEHSLTEAENGAGGYGYVGAYYGKFVSGANYGTPGGSSTPLPVGSVNDLSYPGTLTSYSTTNNMQPIANPVTGGLSGWSAPVAFGVNSSGQCVAANGVYAGINKTGPSLPNPPGDWDTGLSWVPDGAFVNKADEGSTNGISGGSLPYYQDLIAFAAPGATYSSPNRQIPSPLMFGSLPTGVESNKPWQTLLFQPDPGGTPQHIGAQSPPDHLILDLFTMPVVEPYAISDPFSTAGKVNMNYQIVPFTYLTRTTALRAVLKAEQMLVLANTDAINYKNQNASPAFGNKRYFLDLDQTLTGFQNMFATGTTSGTGTTPDIFRSASQICTVYLVPQGQTYSGMASFWNSNLLTGDNVRERPYGDIYPRLTTKSNTFTVHYRVQMLKKVDSTANQWVQGTDVVTAEYRGSSTLERYLDTSNSAIPDYATQAQPLAVGQAIDNFYKFRVVETKQFTP